MHCIKTTASLQKTPLLTGSQIKLKDNKLLDKKKLFRTSNRNNCNEIRILKQYETMPFKYVTDKGYCCNKFKCSNKKGRNQPYLVIALSSLFFSLNNLRKARCSLRTFFRSSFGSDLISFRERILS